MAEPITENHNMNFDTIKRIKDLLSNKDDPLIIEIGAYDGKDTRNFLSIFPKSKVFSFEPDPRNIKKIKELEVNLASIWKCQDRYELIEEAISDEDGWTTFYESHGIPVWLPDSKEKDWSGSGSLNKANKHIKNHPSILFGNGINVFGRKLDTFVKEKNIKYIDLIWADVNGAEIKFIEGARESLKITKYLYTEYSNDAWECGVTVDQLVALLPNFKKIFINGPNILFENLYEIHNDKS